MKHANAKEGEHLPAHLQRFLQDPAAPLSERQQQKLRAARQRALSHFDRRPRAADPLEKLGLWAHRHHQLLRRSSVALGFALLTGLSLILAEGLLAEEEAAALQSQELSIDGPPRPHLGPSLNE